MLCMGLATASLLGACGQEISTPERLPTEASCDPRAMPCLAGTEQRGLSLHLPDNKLRALEPFTVEVRLLGLGAAEVAVEFQMEGMDMGRNRFSLALQGVGLWAGEAMLPVCWSGRRDWRATVELSNAEGRRQAEFRFALKG